ncbi:MAG TPA: universal stress protein, partial [Vicinamibacteria bacterium]|nr:universal stress protein [Vicinamibacteria bacterium]
MSGPAVEQAVTLARDGGAEITALFVSPIPAPMKVGAESADAFGTDPGVRDTVLQDLSRVLQPARTAGVPAWMSLKRGDPVAAVLAEAKSMPADLIVMGTHGRSASRWILGSVAGEVLRKAACPVLTVSPSAAAPPGGAAAGRRILCALDLTRGSDHTFTQALALARAIHAPLTVLHVLEGATAMPAPAL